MVTIIIILFIIFIFLKLRNNSIIAKYDYKDFYNSKLDEIKEKKISKILSTLLNINIPICIVLWGISFIFAMPIIGAIIGSLGLVFMERTFVDTINKSFPFFKWIVPVTAICIIIALIRSIYTNYCMYKLLCKNIKSKK